MKKVLASFAAVVMLSSCASVQSPVTGMLYSDVMGPIGATANGAGSKKGMSCASTILGWVGTGDASIDAAKRNGGISKVTSVDHKSWSVLGLYGKFCTIVRGS